MTSSSSLSHMYKAVADETRLRLLHILTKREMCVGDLVEIIGAPQPTVSRHLSYLRKAGLVEVRKDGLWAHYSLSEPEGSFHERLLQSIGSCFDEVPELTKDAIRAAELLIEGSCCPKKSVEDAECNEAKPTC